MAFIKKRGKIWYLYWRNRNHKQEAKPISPDKEIAIGELKKLEVRLYAKKNGLPIEDMTFEEFLEEYRKEYTKHKRPSSQIRDEVIFKNFITSCPEVEYVRDFNEIALQNYKDRNKNKAASTINREIGTLKHMQRIAFRKKYISENVADLTEREDVEINTYIPSNEEVQIIFDEAKEPYKTAIILGYGHGMRSGEVCHTEIDDFILDENYIDIRKKPDLNWEPKNRTSIRHAPINPDFKPYLISRINAARKIGNTFICFFENGSHLTENLLKGYIYKLKNRKDLKNKINPKFHFHLLRSKFITEGLDQGQATKLVSNIVGHSNTKTTESFYYKQTDAKNLDAMSKIKIPLKIKK